MSQQSQTDARTEHEQINGIDKLHARPLGGHSYVVLSTRNGSVTAHKVDIGTMECPCDDNYYDDSQDGVCDHLAVAIMAAPDSLEWNSMAANDMANYLGRLEGLVTRLESGGNTQAGGTTTSADSGDSASGGDSDDSTSDEGFYSEVSASDVPGYDGIEETFRNMFQHYPGVDPKNVEVVPAHFAGGQAGVVLEFAAPWDSTYDAWDSESNSWGSATEKEAFQSEQEKFREAIKGIDAVKWEGEPHYVRYLFADAFDEVS